MSRPAISLLAFVVLSGATVATALRSPGRSTGSEERDPDIEGVWTYATMTPLERPRERTGKAVLTEAEAAEYERQVLERQATTNNTAGPDWWDPGTRRLTGRRTSLIVDPPYGRMPPLTAEAQQRAAARAQARRERGAPEGPEDLALNERCLIWSTAGPPMLPGVYNNNVQLVQTRHDVLIFNEMIHDARIVPIDGRPHGAARQWMGDSRGHWEGSTLVVETLNFDGRAAFRGSDEKLRLVERFTRVDAETIEYQFLVDDPSIWTQPWTAAFPLHRSTGRIYEYACHEGNARSVEGILRGARSAPQ